MIICFTGTGNSKRVALHIQEILGDEILRLPPGLMLHPEKINMPVHDGRIIWIFPTFAWGLPKTVEKVMRLAHFRSKGQPVHHMVTTCGDDIGNAHKQWRKMMRRRGFAAGSAFSVQMPNTYTAMKGFDVDAPDVVATKMAAEPARSAMIAKQILDGGEPVDDVVRGAFPWVKSSVLRPLFHAFKMSIDPFHATDVCVGCGRCARNCPLGSIELNINNVPEWDGECTMCMRCYHCCPHGAVQYGKSTRGKGQYLCEGYELK